MTYYLETGSSDPYYNLAFEETVFLRRTEGEYLLLWQNENTIVIGLNQNAEEEIDRAFVERHHIHVVRRTTGGGAVYHDMGNLNYSFITDVGDAQRLTMERFTGPVVEALRSLGLNAEASGRNDILVDGRKVSGTAQRILHGRILHHGCILFDANADMISGALRPEPSKFVSKGIRSVRSRVGNIRAALPRDMTMAQFWDHLKRSLVGGGLVPTSLTADELRAVRELRDSKYATWEWNFGCSPPYSLQSAGRFAGGMLRVRLNVEGGRIADAAFSGDFLAVTALDPLVEALRHTPFQRDAVSAVLDAFPLEQMFGAITKDEILQVIFSV